MLALGVDLAWGTGAGARETGVAAVRNDGRVIDAGWTRGISETVEWMCGFDESGVVAFIDAPLVVSNPTGQRTCEKQVGQRYGRWKVSCNSTNLASKHLAGVALFGELNQRGWVYVDGYDGPPLSPGRYFAECYPYTTLVGATELDYDIERPIYKRKPKRVPTADFRQMRADNCDELISRMVKLSQARPPLHLASHSASHALVTEPSPISDTAYKHREDLLDALLCAWTALLWVERGSERCQVLGPGTTADTPRATIIAPTREDQRRHDLT